MNVNMQVYYDRHIPFQIILVIVGALLASCNPDRTTKVTVSANLEWQSTGVQLVAGQSVTISASGQMNLHPGVAPDTGPGGRDGDIDCPISGVNPDLCPIANQPYGMLVGRLGESETFAIGTGTTYTAQSNGVLFLIANDHEGAFDGNTGHYEVDIIVGP